jgi:hypothetical protein
MSPERETEFTELLAFVSFCAPVVFQVNVQVAGQVSADAEHSPARAIDSIIATYGKSKALAGLRQAVNDIVEQTRDWPAGARAALDEGLNVARIITLSEVVRRYASSYKRILKRGTIRNDTEYYLVNGIVVDQASGISDEERAQLQGLVDAYEAM